MFCRSNVLAFPSTHHADEKDNFQDNERPAKRHIISAMGAYKLLTSDGFQASSRADDHRQSFDAAPDPQWRIPQQ